MRKIRPTIFLYIILMYPLLDMLYSINYRILHINIPINQLLRALIMFYLLFKIKRVKNLSVLLIIFFILFIGEIYHIHYGIISLSDDISYLTKIMFFVVSIYGIHSIIKDYDLSTTKLIKLMVDSSILICSSIILSKFGLGFSTWGDNSIRSGVKGLFAVQNTVNVTLLILMPLCLLVYYQTKKTWYLFNYILIFISLTMIGTKSGFVGAIIIASAQIIFIFFKTKMTYLKMSLASFSIPIFMLLIYLSKGYISTFINNQKYVYYSYGYNNIFSFLLSNRDLQISFIQNYLTSVGVSYRDVLFGIGYSFANNIINSGKPEFKAIEMDFYGIYYYSGILILIIVLLLIVKRYISSISLVRKNFNIESFSIFLSINIALVHSYFGGHVIYEALTSLYFGGILAIAEIKCKKFNNLPRKARINEHLKMDNNIIATG